MLSSNKFSKIKANVSKKEEVLVFKDYREEEKEEHGMEEVLSDAPMEEGEYDMEDDFDEEIKVPKTKSKNTEDKLSAGFDDYGGESVDEDEEAMRKRMLDESDQEADLQMDDEEMSDL